jgi:hypothetical protein
MALATQAVFELANLMMEKPFYEVETYAMSGAVRASAGLALQAKPFTAHSRADTWLVAGNLLKGRRSAPADPVTEQGDGIRPARGRPVHGRFPAGRRGPA